MNDLRTPPALTSLRLTGQAIDMSISWNGLEVTLINHIGQPLGIKLKRRLLCLLVLFVLLDSSSAADTDNDFIAFVKNADYCQTLAGEAGDMSAADAAVLNKSIDIACGTAKKKYSKLMKKYKNNEAMKRKIAEHYNESVMLYQPR